MKTLKPADAAVADIEATDYEDDVEEEYYYDSLMKNYDVLN